MRKKVEREGFEFLTQTKVPCGDGGVSLGQAVIAAEKIRN
jgi:hydrogenase maturation protein HypF